MIQPGFFDFAVRLHKVDASIVNVPKQRNSRENEFIAKKLFLSPMR